MTVMTQIILAVALVLSIIVPFGYYFIGEKSRGRYKTTIATNAIFLLWYHVSSSNGYVCRKLFCTGCNRR